MSYDTAMVTSPIISLLAGGQTPAWMKFILLIMALLVGSFYAVYKWYHA